MKTLVTDLGFNNYGTLGRGESPADLLTVEQSRRWADLDGRCVRIGEAECDVTDVDGTYSAWLDEIGAEFVILRPDFYVAATASDTAGLQASLDTILAGLHLTVDVTTPAA
ncbi:hypothetical protein [Rhodococcus sp. LW-XY12]|uniref:hypothetical protein n=1 Tax=Rhodococcus sp. LW-XY12 TaxID=2856851 RepID=UPI00214B854C|nr:hypothetical protein [Rhodococcus sp. LW-XY12]